MTSSDRPTDDLRRDEAVHEGRGSADPDAMRQLADQLHDCITKTFEAWNANTDASTDGSRRETKAFARPVTAPPVRMEQMARTPEPTADLDDLVDLLVPRLLDQLVPALRQALREDD